MPLYLRETDYSGGINLDTTLNYGQLDGNFIYLDEKFKTGPFTGSLSGSLQGTASYATTASHAISSSYALTASYYGGTVSAFPFTGSAQITGSLVVIGRNYNLDQAEIFYAISGETYIGTTDLTIYTLNNNIYSNVNVRGSGTNNFGFGFNSNQVNNFANEVNVLGFFNMTGSAKISGSFGVTGSVNLGNSISTIHNITGSTRITGSLTITGSTFI
jgi:hypothetical protein